MSHRKPNTPSRKTVTGQHTPSDGLKHPQFLEKIIEGVADPLFVKDESHRWIMLNQSFCDFMGHAKENLLGKSDYDFFPEDEADVFWRKDEEVFASGQTNINEEQLTDAEGKTHVIVTKKSVFEDHEGNKVLVGVIRDITELKVVQEKLKDARDDLERKVEERSEEVKRTQALLLQSQKMDAIGQLAGGIAHDFNNLLSVVQGSLELIMLRSAGEAHLEGLAEQSLSAIARGATLTQRMLAFSRQQTLMPRPTNLAYLLKSVEILLRRSLSADYELDLEFESEDLAATTDPAQLETAFINLALNARDAMPNGGLIKIRVHKDVVNESQVAELDGVKPGSYAVITISDEGIGMSAETATKIFEPFFTTKTDKSATGLGLSMVYGFVKQSGGAITVETEPSQGTTMRMYLPQTKGLYALDATEKAPTIDAGPGQGRYVMVVEDEPTVRSMTTMFLQALGYQVYNASDADDANEKLNKIGHIDVLLTDLTLGKGQNGYQLAQELIVRRPGLRHIYMTGHADENLRDEVIKDSAPLLTKPFRLTHLEKTLRDVLTPGN